MLRMFLVIVIRRSLRDKLFRKLVQNEVFDLLDCSRVVGVAVPDCDEIGGEADAE